MCKDLHKSNLIYWFFLFVNEGKRKYIDLYHFKEKGRNKIFLNKC